MLFPLRPWLWGLTLSGRSLLSPGLLPQRGHRGHATPAWQGGRLPCLPLSSGQQTCQGLMGGPRPCFLPHGGACEHPSWCASQAGLRRGLGLPDPDGEVGPHPSAVGKSRRSRADVTWAPTCGCRPLSPGPGGSAGRRWGRPSSTRWGPAQSYAETCPPLSPNALPRGHGTSLLTPSNRNVRNCRL